MGLCLLVVGNETGCEKHKLGIDFLNQALMEREPTSALHKERHHEDRYVHRAKMTKSHKQIG